MTDSERITRLENEVKRLQKMMSLTEGAVWLWCITVSAWIVSGAYL